MKRRIYIFDIDGTILCSKHRALTKPCGSIDLEHWRENCTAEKIMQDRILPLAWKMRQAKNTGAIVTICTSRVMQEADYLVLEKHGLKFDHIECRGINDMRPDGIYKRDKLQRILDRYDCPPNRALFYDDNDSVLEAARDMGIIVFDAKLQNTMQVAI